MPEKKLYDLTVDPEFRDLIPPLNKEELKLLEESLVADGCEFIVRSILIIPQTACAAAQPPEDMTRTGERRGRCFCPGIRCAPNA